MANWTIERLFLDDTWRTTGDCVAQDVVNIMNDPDANWSFYELDTCWEIRYYPIGSPKFTIARKAK